MKAGNKLDHNAMRLIRACKKGKKKQDWLLIYPIPMYPMVASTILVEVAVGQTSSISYCRKIHTVYAAQSMLLKSTSDFHP